MKKLVILGLLISLNTFAKNDFLISFESQKSLSVNYPIFREELDMTVMNFDYERELDGGLYGTIGISSGGGVSKIFENGSSEKQNQDYNAFRIGLGFRY